MTGVDGKEPGARVIAAFPATGKSHMASTVPGVADSDSSLFSRGPEWPDSYIDHLVELGRTSLSYILVSTHPEVRRALVDHGIGFTLVYPAEELRDEYRKRMESRGSLPGLVTKVIDELWESALAECRAQCGCQHVELGPGEYLLDALDFPRPDVEGLAVLRHVAGLVSQDEDGYSKVHLAVIEDARAALPRLDAEGSTGPEGRWWRCPIHGTFGQEMFDAAGEDDFTACPVPTYTSEACGEALSVVPAPGSTGES